MGPSHTSRMTSTTTSEGTSRRGTRQVQKPRTDKHDEAVDAHKGVGSSVHADSDDDGEGVPTTASQDASQVFQDVRQELNEINDVRKKRIHELRDEVYKTYDEAHAETKDAITSHIDEFEARALKAHEAQMARLKGLLKLKAQIETRMAEKVEVLRKDFVAHSRTLELVVEHRMKEIK